VQKRAAKSNNKLLGVIMNEDKKITGLALLRLPFNESQISKLPKPTKRLTDIIKQDYKQGVRCKLCGGWHHKDVVHLDYVGHAALTDRLLDADPEWNWEPVTFTELGLPALDQNGGMWIKLTVCGITRLGYGDAPNKKGGDATKEIIGDALRNSAMRFGAALDLWHKGDLHADDEPETQDAGGNENQAAKSEPQVVPIIDQNQWNQISAYCVENGQWTRTGKMLMRDYGINSVQNLPANKFNEAMQKSINNA
jgi:hypothetical protein